MRFRLVLCCRLLDDVILSAAKDLAWRVARHAIWPIALRSYFVYIMASRSGTLYVGVTGDLPARVYEHKHGLTPGFTSKYRVNRLVYFEETELAVDAIAREKQIKGWLRKRKIALVESLNPNWKDLSLDW